MPNPDVSTARKIAREDAPEVRFEGPRSSSSRAPSRPNRPSERQQTTSSSEGFIPPTPRRSTPEPEASPPTFSHSPSGSGAAPSRDGEDGDLYAVLAALAPVSRASFKALKDRTGIEDRNLLALLARLEEAGMVSCLDQATGHSSHSFALTERAHAARPELRRNTPKALGPSPRNLALAAHPEARVSAAESPTGRAS